MSDFDLFWSAGSSGQSSLILGAMISSIPVIALDTPSNRELITPGQTGMLFGAGDRAVLARQSRRLLVDRDFASHLGRQSRRHAEDWHDAETPANRYMGIYRKITNKPGILSSAVGSFTR